MLILRQRRKVRVLLLTHMHHRNRHQKSLEGYRTPTRLIGKLHDVRAHQRILIALLLLLGGLWVQCCMKH